MGFFDMARRAALTKGKQALKAAHKIGSQYVPNLTKKAHHIWKRTSGVRKKIGLGLETAGHAADAVAAGRKVMTGDVVGGLLEGVDSARKAGASGKKLINSFKKPKVKNLVHAKAIKQGLHDVSRAGNDQQKSRINPDKINNMINSI